MSVPTDPADAAGSPDSTPTEAIQVPDHPPAAPAAPAVSRAAHSGGDHTRTILEVVGGVVAVGLILAAGVAGFLIGHATGSDDRGPWGFMDSSAHARMHDGQRGPGELPGGGQGPGRWTPGDGWGQGPMMDGDQGDGRGQGPGQGPMMDGDESDSSEPNPG